MIHSLFCITLYRPFPVNFYLILGAVDKNAKFVGFHMNSAYLLSIILSKIHTAIHRTRSIHTPDRRRLCQQRTGNTWRDLKRKFRQQSKIFAYTLSQKSNQNRIEKCVNRETSDVFYLTDTFIPEYFLKRH